VFHEGKETEPNMWRDALYRMPFSAAFKIMLHQCNNQYKNQRIDKAHKKTVTSEQDSENRISCRIVF
jgi:hypothetical protein